VKSFLAPALALGLAVAASAQSVVNVSSDITTSTTWTANNVYNLTTQVYVTNGASLTIQAGTVVASTTNGGGSLAVTRGAQIFVQGTQNNPVIMTSTADQATWVGGNPKTGTWRAAANEWGNLTICGNAYISENATAGNTATPNAANYAVMEGLTAAFPGDTRNLYGGGNDDDDSGSISYLSIRYGGKVVGLNNELNGLSLGGIGRGTEIRNVEIMNNVDDGIEIWGGTCNLKYVSIWNVGDDSLDIDQGYRGKVQFGLIVQGYSVLAAQGSGIGDNAIEIDGAEQSDYQPVTSTALYNFTVVGQPVSGDHGIAYRDNARVQVRNSVFMDLGEQFVRNDNVDGDGGAGYGHNGTLTWASTWTTPFNSYSTVNAPAIPADFYKAQVDGFLNDIRDTVVFRNLFATAYTEATARGVFAAGNDNVQIASVAAVDAPITTVTRGAPAVFGALTMVPVTFLDPRPKNAALTAVHAAPNDGFFTPAYYRGAFAPADTMAGTKWNWLATWTASEAFGMTPKSYRFTMSQAGPGASLVISNFNGGAFNGYFNAITLSPQPNLGAGWLAGIDMPLIEVVTLFFAGAPFSGGLDAAGQATYPVPAGLLPPGITLYQSSLEFLGGAVVGVEPAFAYTSI
jgi:hypothetical protein